jgi:hypothetical protein
MPGGGDAMLRVSYRGVILAWGGVPRFTIDVRPAGTERGGGGDRGGQGGRIRGAAGNVKQSSGLLEG